MERSDDDEDFLKAHACGTVSEEYSEFVELDPTRRYGRYSEVLGKGAYKTVYKAFDELDGIEVAWNQVNIQETLHNSGNMERLYSELHLLKMLKHQNIMKFCNSWVDTRCKNVNFITEIFTSGTLRQYRKKHKHVKLRAIKNWSRQILQGLVYLHDHDPPIIHRDLKCDNIFINGNSGEVKIGDLGLAVILSQAPAAHSVIGTPEFMAPELYEEHYNQLVDIYSFGMCILEMISFEYPYSECTNAAQIYKKVTSGKRPEALEKVRDPEIRKFVEKCLASASERLSAKELLMDPFLQIEKDQENVAECCQSVMQDPYDDLKDLGPVIKEPSARADAGKASECKEDKLLKEGNSSKSTSISHENNVLESPRGWKRSMDFRINLKQQDETKVLIRFRITSATGGVRLIQFDFDIETDTAMSVACEMVAELDLSDQDPKIIASMIDAELMTLFPDWVPRDWLDETGGDEKQQEPVLESSEVQELQADDVDGSSVPADCLAEDPDSRNEVLVYGRFEEVGCNLSGSLRPQQELEGLGIFSDFFSENCEGGGTDLSLDASCDNLKAETSVSDRSTRLKLEGDNGEMRTKPSKESEGSKKEIVALLTLDHKLDGDVGPEELLVLALEQKREIESLQSKHNQELLDLKTHLKAEANTSMNGPLSPKWSSTQAINNSKELSAGDLGESLWRIINEVSPNTCKESMLQPDISMDKVNVNRTFTTAVVVEQSDNKTIDRHMQPEISFTQLGANPELLVTPTSKDWADSEGFEDAKEPVHASISCIGKMIMAQKSCLTASEFGHLEGVVLQQSGMCKRGASMTNDGCLESTDKREAPHELESTTEPEGRSLSCPEGVMQELPLSTKREYHLEYKAGINQKDKKLDTNDLISKSSDSKGEGLEQVRKQQLQKSIAELEAKTLKGLSHSSSSYLVKKC